MCSGDVYLLASLLVTTHDSFDASQEKLHAASTRIKEHPLFKKAVDKAFSVRLRSSFYQQLPFIGQQAADFDNSGSIQGAELYAGRPCAP